jgi:hypothetical protein
MQYWVRMESKRLGATDFGPYKSLKECGTAVVRAMEAAAESKDGAERWFRVIAIKLDAKAAHR